MQAIVLESCLDENEEGNERPTSGKLEIELVKSTDT